MSHSTRINLGQSAIVNKINSSISNLFTKINLGISDLDFEHILTDFNNSQNIIYNLHGIIADKYYYPTRKAVLNFKIFGD